MNNATEKNTTITAWKGIMACIIAINHTISWTGNQTRGRINYLCVECFFIISGYLLAKSMQRHGIHPMKAITKKFLEVYPIYFAVAAITVVLCLIYPDLKFSLGVSKIGIIVESLMIQQLFGRWNLLNGADWYISAWLIASLFILTIEYFAQQKRFLKIFGNVLLSAAACYYFAQVLFDGFVNFTMKYSFLWGGVWRALGCMTMGLCISRAEIIVKE